MSKITVAVDFMADEPLNVLDGANQVLLYSSVEEQIVVVGPESIAPQLKYGGELVVRNQLMVRLILEGRLEEELLE